MKHLVLAQKLYFIAFLSIFFYACQPASPETATTPEPATAPKDATSAKPAAAAEGPKSVAPLGDKSVMVNFDKTINDFTVSVYWRPNKLVGNTLTGPGIISFTKEGVSYKVPNNLFGLPSNLITAAYNPDNTVISLNQNYILAQYADHEIQGNTIGNASTPFFFYDLDRDGKKELILTKYDRDEAGKISYKAIPLTENGKRDVSVVMDKPHPFNNLDPNTKLPVKK